MLARTIVPTPVTVTVGPVKVIVPAMPAARWIQAVCTNHERAIVPEALTGDDYRRVYRAMLVGRIEESDLADASHEALAQATGRRWWEAVKLIGWCDQPDGLLLGELILSGIDPERTSIGNWCSAVYALVMRNRDEADRARMEISLIEPPASVKPEDIGDWDTGIPEGFSAELPPGTA